MFKYFSAASKANRAIADAVYDQIVAAARQTAPYSDWDVPDTPLGRFEMVALHLFLFLHRIKGEGRAADALGQELADTFFLDVDHSLRELGISDMGVPKRMKKLSRMFYGRTVAYEQAIDANDRPALAAALARNIRPEAADWAHAPALAVYVMEAARDLASQPLDGLLAGQARFPDAGGAHD